jgi:hypothetical protein
MPIDDIEQRVPGNTEALGTPPPMRCGGCGRMLSPNDTECGRCGRAVGRGTHLRWYLSWGVGLVGAAAVVSLFGFQHGPRRMAILFAGTLVVGIGAAVAWRARRPAGG